MNYVSARDALVTKINAAFTTNYPLMPVFYENTLTADLAKVGEMFVKVEIDFIDRIAVTVNNEPETESEGEVVLTVFSKEGTGSRKVLALFDFLNQEFRYQTIGALVLKTPTPGTKAGKNGWASSELICGFCFTSMG
jgi:hypothetical protein